MAFEIEDGVLKKYIQGKIINLEKSERAEKTTFSLFIISIYQKFIDGREGKWRYMFMKKREISKVIRTVYQELRALLSLLEETEFFNKVPKGEKVAENSNGDDAVKYVERKIAEIRKSVAPLFPKEGEIVRKLDQIIDETEHFTKQYEIPGVVTRWKQINPQLIYFDCAFDIMEECPEIYTDMRNGLTDVRLSCYPDSGLAAQRNAYFARVKERYKRKNIECSEDRIFQDELLKTLTLLFEDEFQEYL